MERKIRRQDGEKDQVMFEEENWRSGEKKNTKKSTIWLYIFFSLFLFIFVFKFMYINKTV